MRRRLHSRVLRALAISVTVVLVLGIVLVVRHGDRSASAVSPAMKPSKGFYLDVGASTSLGFQPTGIPAHNGKRTDTGYANDLVAYEAKRGIHLTMRQV